MSGASKSFCRMVMRGALLPACAPSGAIVAVPFFFVYGHLRPFGCVRGRGGLL